MDIRDGLAGAIGGTPLIKLRRVSEATRCTVLGKAEFLNPGGSVKDRAALFILLDAERRGVIEPGSTVLEGTAGDSGVGLFLKEKRKEIVIALADPMGAAMYNWFKHGELRSEGDSVTEGIGQGRITANVDGTPVDEAYQIPDEEALPILFDLVNDEGLFLGGSSGINVA